MYLQNPYATGTANRSSCAIYFTTTVSGKNITRSERVLGKTNSYHTPKTTSREQHTLNSRDV